jgi:hypothetical protein
MDSHHFGIVILLSRSVSAKSVGRRRIDFQFLIYFLSPKPQTLSPLCHQRNQRLKFLRVFVPRIIRSVNLCQSVSKKYVILLSHSVSAACLGKPASPDSINQRLATINQRLLSAFSYQLSLINYHLSLVLIC